METPNDASLEEHQTALGSVTFSAQELSTEDEDASVRKGQRGDIFFSSDQRPQLEPDGDILDRKKSFTFVCYNTMVLRETVCFQEPKQVLPDAAPGTSQLLVENYPSISYASNGDCCLPPPAHAAEVQLNQFAQKQPDPSLNLYSTSAQRGLKDLEPISNGSTISQACASTLEIPANLLAKISDLPHVVKQRPSTITFSTSTGSACINSQASGYDSSDGEESSEEEKEKFNFKHEDLGKGDDDVFLEWPHSKDHHMTKRKQKKRGCLEPQADSVCTPSTCGYEAEEEISNKEESPQVTSPWPESMSQLMRKLDQLNQDIEEALSASSSPSDTPCIARKKQWGAASKSSPNQTQNDTVLQRAGRRECWSQDTSSASCSSSTGTKARNKKMMFHKMTKAAGAGCSR